MATVSDDYGNNNAESSSSSSSNEDLAIQILLWHHRTYQRHGRCNDEYPPHRYQECGASRIETTPWHSGLSSGTLSIHSFSSSHTHSMPATMGGATFSFCSLILATVFVSQVQARWDMLSPQYGAPQDVVRRQNNQNPMIKIDAGYGEMSYTWA
jgi:hypothetical protein